MCRSRRIILLCLLAAACAGGCASLKQLFKKPPPESDPIPPSTQYVLQQPIRVITEERPVKVGELPLVYLLEHPGEVRVVDATAGVIIIGTQAGGRTILSISADAGVTIAGRTIRAGPLDPTHRYEIYLTVRSENTVKNTLERR
ncbi:MAG TPA: hypothetical protein PLD59_11825 [Tepidisphaeraceae bacterium]|nr:hypothetical protein [Tepidisphaeraceae bacterium]